MRNPFLNYGMFARLWLLSSMLGMAPVIIVKIMMFSNDQTIRDQLPFFMGVSLMVVPVAALCIAAASANSMERTFAKLLFAQRQFRCGDFNFRIPVEGDRSTAGLLRGYNGMADFVQATYEQVARSAQDAARKDAELAKEKAVATMTQMLAHDVRKPFSLLRMGLAMLNKAKNPDDIKRVLGTLTPLIDNAVSSVDGLIADVLEVGSTSTQLMQEVASPESLFESSLSDIFRVYPHADISVRYDLKHTHMTYVHAQKVRRVLSNIIDNAVQAMNYQGQLWIKTKEVDGFVEFCLGNSGSVIPTVSLPKLFETFYTSGKRGGTGLGLAIAEKVVKAHGGRIWCESSQSVDYPDGAVEFFFTLPIAPGYLSKAIANLPLHSSEIVTEILALTEPGTNKPIFSGHPLGVERVEVLVVDDSHFILEAWKHALNDDAQVHVATSLADLDELLSKDSELIGRLALAVTDFHLNDGVADGADIGRRLKSMRMDLDVLLSSDGTFDLKELSGAIDGVIGKDPVPLSSLLATLQRKGVEAICAASVGALAFHKQNKQVITGRMASRRNVTA